MNAPTAAKTATTSRHGLPFDADHLDQLLDEAGIDVLIASTRHNIQYLVGGDYRFFFFEHFDANGISRYLPLLIYVRGKPEATVYIGNGMEAYEKENGRFWMPTVEYAGTSLAAMSAAVAHMRRLGSATIRIGVERAFLPADVEELLRHEMPRAEIRDALFPLERLRAVKTPRELKLLREASEKVVESMLAVMASHGPGTTKRELAEALKREEISRGLEFEYCLLTAGRSLNRAPSPQRLNAGDILSLDSGGNYHGYIGDLCRMAILGEPDSELVDLLGAIEEVQQAARKPIRAGAIGREIYVSAGEVLRNMPHANRVEFVAHGMGLVTHEAPRLTDTGPIPYPATDADKPLQAGMVLSIETTLPHPTRGFIKLEDTVAVTKDGWEAFGDSGRGWNRGGTAV
jgi:Xaa-Pro aminopeptidase